MQNNDIEEIVARPMTEQERYYEEQFYKEPVESVKRIEETAKVLIGSVAGTSGLYLAAFKLSFGDRIASGGIWFLQFLLWAFSIIALILVLLPQEYDTGKNEPASYKSCVSESSGTQISLAGLGSGAFYFRYSDRDLCFGEVSGIKHSWEVAMGMI